MWRSEGMRSRASWDQMALLKSAGIPRATSRWRVRRSLGRWFLVSGVVVMNWTQKDSVAAWGMV